MKKIFLLLFFIGITTFPKQGWTVPACNIIGIYQPNSRVWDVSISTETTSSYCGKSGWYACFTSESSCSSGYQYAGEYNSFIGYYYADTNCSSPSGLYCWGCSSGFTRIVSASSGYSGLYNNCCLNGGTGICNVQKTHECHPDNCEEANMVHTNSGTSSASCTCVVSCASNELLQGGEWGGCRILFLLSIQRNMRWFSFLYL